jgi:phosphopantetheine--protein transferase-like protein
LRFEVGVCGERACHNQYVYDRLQGAPLCIRFFFLWYKYEGKEQRQYGKNIGIEIEYINTYKNDELRRQSCAGLWAVKEAVFKMLELGRYSGVSFKNVELYHNQNGKPYVKLNGVALDKFKQLELTEIEVSISHTSDYAVANVVARG